MSQFNCVDLFTGVAGMQLALQGMCKPLLYCEIDPMCHKVLQKNMDRGKLPRAPIISDVRDTKAIMAAIGSRPVHMLISTSSCKGFSSANRDATGLQHDETNLMLQSLNLIKRIRPACVFLENVPGIRTTNDGRDHDLVIEFLHKCGYRVREGFFDASSVGAPHMRKRWYCVGLHRDVEENDFIRRVRRLVAKKKTRAFKWSVKREESEIQHFVPRNPTNKHRLRMMGNAVVPECARDAFLRLTGALPRQAEHDRKIERDFVLDPTKYRFKKMSEASPSLTTGVYKKPIRVGMLPTPRAGCIGYANFLTHRCLRDLPTVLRFWVKAKGPRTNGKMNPNFLEYMMGFPDNWTRF